MSKIVDITVGRLMEGGAKMWTNVVSLRKNILESLTAALHRIEVIIFES